MGFRYNRIRTRVVEHDGGIANGDVNKKKNSCRNSAIRRTHVKQLRHKLPAELRAFLLSIGLKPRKN